MADKKGDPLSVAVEAATPLRALDELTKPSPSSSRNRRCRLREMHTARGVGIPD